MPKGFAGLREKLQEIEERKARAQEGGDGDFQPSLWFKLPDSANGKSESEITAGMRAVIRPLEEGEEVAYAAVHPVSVPNRQWDLDIVCRDQENTGEACPGCELGIKRGLKGWINVIWRDAPDFPQDSETGKYITKIDYESIPDKSDKLAILSSGPVLFGRLDELNEDLGGLAGYDFSITRHGLKLATKYKIKKVKKVALSAADKELAENKPDLSRFIRIPEYDDWVKRAQGIQPSQNGSDEEPAVPKNPLSGGLKNNIFAN